MHSVFPILNFIFVCKEKQDTGSNLKVCSEDEQSKKEIQDPYDTDIFPDYMITCYTNLLSNYDFPNNNLNNF